MRVFVVVDLLGAGRLVGVFTTEERAREVVGSWPHYYKIHDVETPDFRQPKRGTVAYVLVDVMGGGGILGVFAFHPPGAPTHYLKVWEGRIDQISEAALGWAIDDGQRAHLRRLMGRK